ncbi:hypothetical protein [Polycladidibacter stylochi]|uniref:hypothetical protein n=1 Tax=Polycladidibacter stylochi TaxID=1807766 RepID=UPI00082CABB9|nr:hypothetical protein [Pseudovibrio stylochi]
MKFVRVSKQDGTWQEFSRCWIVQAEKNNISEDEVFDNLKVLEDLLEDVDRSGTFVTNDDQNSIACFINLAKIPNHTGTVARVRHMKLCPNIDCAGTFDDFVEALVAFMGSLIKFCREIPDLNCAKVHLRSPADLKFLKEFTKELESNSILEKSSYHGSWIEMYFAKELV